MLRPPYKKCAQYRMYQFSTVSTRAVKRLNNVSSDNSINMSQKINRYVGCARSTRDIIPFIVSFFSDNSQLWVQRFRKKALGALLGFEWNKPRARIKRPKSQQLDLKNMFNIAEWRYRFRKKALKALLVMEEDDLVLGDNQSKNKYPESYANCVYIAKCLQYRKMSSGSRSIFKIVLCLQYRKICSIS